MTTSERDLPALPQPAAAQASDRTSLRQLTPRALASLSVAAALGAAVWAALVTRIWEAPANDPDSAASVLFFQRLVDGRHLEAFVATTPKPLLTLVYGVAMALTGEWRVLGFVTIAAFAVAVGCAAMLTGRVLAPAGPRASLAGAVFAVVALALWPNALTEVYGANSFVWALALWLVAAVALTASRPHYWVAGVALALSGLVRTESWLLIGLAAVAVVALAVLGRVRADHAASERARRASPLLLGLLAPVVACLHDFLLTGSPLYWQQVPSGYTQLMYPGLHLGLSGYLRLVRESFTPYLAFAVLAAVGVGWLLWTRRTALAASMVWLAGGIVALLWYVSNAGTFVTPRYFEQVMAVGIVGAAVGAGALAGVADTAIRRAMPRPGSDRAPADRSITASPPAWNGAVRSGLSRALASFAAAAVAGALGAVLCGALAWGGPAISTNLATVQGSTERLGRVAETVCAATNGAAGEATGVARVPLPVVDERSSRVFVPRPLVNRVVAQCHADVRAVGDTTLAFGSAAPEAVLRPGDLLLHDRLLDGSRGPFASFESARPVGIGSVRLVPLLADAAAGLWLYRVEAP